jgi:hypothetical protein
MVSDSFSKFSDSFSKFSDSFSKFSDSFSKFSDSFSKFSDSFPIGSQSSIIFLKFSTVYSTDHYSGASTHTSVLHSIVKFFTVLSLLTLTPTAGPISQLLYVAIHTVAYTSMSVALQRGLCVFW